MSTSLLYNAFGIRGYEYVSTSYDESQVTFDICQSRHRLRCPSCRSNVVWSRGRVPGTGPLERTNTRIQAMKRQAYGFRNQEFFKLKILVGPRYREALQRQQD